MPKRDEVKELATILSFDAEHPDVLVGEEKAAWRLPIGDLSVVIVLAESQRAAELLSATRNAIEELDPSVAICVGTAAGRAGRVNYLDTVIATSVLDVTEWSSEVTGFEPRWNDPLHLPRDCERDVDDFVRGRPQIDPSLAKYSYQEASQVRIPKIGDGWIATTPFLHRQGENLQAVWAIQSRLKAVDMETSGFVQGCTTGPKRCPWYAIRTISDFGTKETKRDDLRPAAGRVAGEVLQLFIESGLKRTHPKALQASDPTDLTLSESNFFSARGASSYFAAAIKTRLMIDVEPTLLLRELTLRDLAELCRGFGAKGSVFTELEEIRREYYEEKYADYNNDADIRSFSGDAWAEEFLGVCEYLSVNASECDIIYVGIGEGRDVHQIFPEFKSLCGVDVASLLLEKAQKLTPKLRAVTASAEVLDGIEDDSADLFVSLRALQSTFLDVRAAVREAHRVLRPGGAFIASIPAFFIDGQGAETRVVPGLITPGTTIVDPGLPRRIGERIIRQLNNLAFTGVGFHLRDTEYYIYARK